MPCSDGGPSVDLDYAENEVKQLKTRLDQATRVACDLVGAIRAVDSKEVRIGILEDISGDTRRWIIRHDKEDATREAREKLQIQQEMTRLEARIEADKSALALLAKSFNNKNRKWLE